MNLPRRTVVAFLFFPSSLLAQSIRGQLVDASSGAPVGGSIVGLIDAAGVQRASALSDESGRFLLPAPAEGTYTLRSLRIGIRSVTSPPVVVPAGQTVQYRFAVHAEAILLDAVRVTARSKSCDVRPQETQAAGLLWSEARKALTATSITQRDRAFTVSLRRYERDLDPSTMRVLNEQSVERSGVTENPFVGLPAEELAANGYVRKSIGGTIYYAPDAQALLSDHFLDVHCLRALPEQQDAKGLVGVAFEPVKKRDLPDVKGVLWLDRETAELRFMEYHYTGLSSAISSAISSERFGGRVDFRRVPTGAWIVERWAIRMPVVAVADRYGAIVPGESLKRETLRMIREEGGEVTSFAKGSRGEGVIAGVVFDSTRRLPLVGARVFLSGTSHWALSDSLGRYTLSVPAGTYGVSFVHDRLDSLRWVAPGTDVTLAPGASVDLALVVPVSAAPAPVVAVRATETEAPVAREPVARYELIDAKGPPVVVGEVRDLSGIAVPSAQVSVVAPNAPRTRTADDGTFRLAGLAPGGYKLSVQRIGFRTRAMTIEVAKGKSTRVFVELEAVAAPLPQRRVIASRDRNGFEQRRKMGNGYYLEREQIEARRAPRFTEVLRTVPGVRLVPTSGEMGAEYRIEMGRSGLERKIRQRAPVPAGAAPAVGAGSPGGDGVDERAKALAENQPTGESACPIEYWVDGSRFVPTSGSIDNDIRPDIVDAIEVYQGSLAPSQFRSMQHTCGVIVIWTKNGPNPEKR
jgi:carboxypeptidase family protein